MNRKQLLLILGLAVVIGGLGLWLYHRNQSAFGTSQGSMGQKVLGEFDLNSIGQILIRNASNEVSVVQKDDQWVVSQRGGYPANFTDVSDLLRKLWDLKTVQPVEIGPSQLARLELVAPGTPGKAGTLVELKTKDGKTVHSLLLGKKHTRASAQSSALGGDEGWPDGRYVMPDNKTTAVSLVAEAFSNVEPNPDQWLNKKFFEVVKPKSISVTYAVATNSYLIQKETETGDWKLAGAKEDEKLDTSKVASVSSGLSYPSFKDVVVDPKPDVTGLDQPTVASIETFEGFHYTLKIGKPSGEDASFMTVEVKGTFPTERTAGKDEKAEDKDKLDKEFKEATEKLQEKLKREQAFGQWTYVVPKYTFDGLLKERHALLVEKKPEVKPAAGATNAPPPAIAAPEPAAEPTR